MNIFKRNILTIILPFLTAWYTILYTRRLQPTRDDCTVRVQWFSSVTYAAIYLACDHRTFSTFQKKTRKIEDGKYEGFEIHNVTAKKMSRKQEKILE